MSVVYNLVSFEVDIKDGSTDTNGPVADVDDMLLSETIPFCC